MNAEAGALRYVARPRVVAKYLGQLLGVVGVLTLAPLAVAMFTGAWPVAWRYALVSAALMLTGLGARRIPAPERVQPSEGISLAALLFLIVPLIMTLPMTGAGLSFVDALFETVSGATTTGLSTLPTMRGAHPVFLFARAWMQWYGGLGIVVLTLALVARPGPEAKSLAVTEEHEEDLVGGTRAYARRILKIYLLLTALCWLLVAAVSGLPFRALLYALAAVSTGGFAPADASLSALPGAAQPLVMFGCLAGALPLAVYHPTTRRGTQGKLLRHQVLLILAACLLSSGLLAVSMLLSGAAPGHVLTHAPLMAVSAQTTAGFSSLDTAALDPASKVLLMVSMLAGGGVGSTAGGIKILRLAIAWRLVQVLVVRTRLARHAHYRPALAGGELEWNRAVEALTVIFLYAMVLTLSWLPFVAAGLDPLNSLFEVVSALGTVGLSAGITAPDLAPGLKGVLCADMLLGRLEILAWLVLLSPRTWFGRRFD